MNKRFSDLLDEARARVREIMPWDLEAQLKSTMPPLLVDVREPGEFGLVHIAGALSVPRGILEQACEWDHDETEPVLAGDRARPVVVICRSGNRSLLAAEVMMDLGFTDVVSLRTGMRGWVDYEQPVVDETGGSVEIDTAEQRLAAKVRPDQRAPQ